jgi:Protein of unknown function (DUF5133)
MSTPHPLELRNLIDQYEALQVLYAVEGGFEARRRMNDAAYSLCVMTGTRDVDTALLVSRHQLSRAETGERDVSRAQAEPA